jgi:hypothetical protein
MFIVDRSRLHISALIRNRRPDDHTMKVETYSLLLSTIKIDVLDVFLF